MEVIIGFSRSKSKFKIGSKIIQLGEKRPYSHSYVRFSYLGSDLIAQASHGMVNIVNFKYFAKENIVVGQYKIECSQQQFDDLLLKYVLENLGKKYGYVELLLIAIKKLIRIELPDEHKDDYVICSQFASNVAALIGLKFTNASNYITPSDLEQILLNNGVAVA